MAERFQEEAALAVEGIVDAAAPDSQAIDEGLHGGVVVAVRPKLAHGVGQGGIDGELL